MKILILGQTPPPYGGQAINIEKMMRSLDTHEISYRFIRMDFSNEINDMGRLSLRKVGRLMAIFCRLLFQLVVYRPAAVYYPPAGPQYVPILRDMILLFPIRLFGFTTIFHFHAGGLAETYSKLNPLLRWLYRFCYFNAACSICLSEQGKTDPTFLRSKKIVVIPSGVEDIGHAPEKIPTDGHCTVLFAGLCSESKGILDFIAILRTARLQNPAIRGQVLGKPFSEKENSEINKAVAEGILNFEGVRTGEEKNCFFAQADIFLFPSFFESENFPTVILEAFSAGLPVVATQWRGIPDQVRSGYNGFVHQVHDIEGMADSVLKLAADPIFRKKLGANSRHDFETKYTMSNFTDSIANFYKSLG
jgi:glycosyltransferase involved in cell wall biosynthesis